MGKYFTIEELTKSDTAVKLNINNNPSKAIIRNIEYLIDVVLDPLRKLLNKPITVNSGYRCEELNKVLKGSVTSAHKTGLAADLCCSGNSKEIYNVLVNSNIPYDQVILEKGTLDRPNWVHVSITRTGRNRYEKLYYNGKSYIKI